MKIRHQRSHRTVVRLQWGEFLLETDYYVGVCQLAQSMLTIHDDTYVVIMSIFHVSKIIMACFCVATNHCLNFLSKLFQCFCYQKTHNNSNDAIDAPLSEFLVVVLEQQNNYRFVFTSHGLLNVSHNVWYIQSNSVVSVMWSKFSL